MKCLRKYEWVKLPRDYPDMGKGLMSSWAKLASRAAFRKGNAKYCGHVNPVTPGMWAGGIVGIKSILGVKSRAAAFQILDQLVKLGYLRYEVDRQTKKLTYEISDWVVKCSGAECMEGVTYTTEGYGFLCMPRSITERLWTQKRTFEEADAWLDLWCHTIFEDHGNAFSFLYPAVQYGKYGSVLTLETLGQRWGWEKTKVWRFFKKHKAVFSLHRLPSSYLCHKYNVPLIINDNVEVALKSGADGVHVGIEDVPVAEIRKRVSADFIIGATCKTVEQAKIAEAAGADYMGVGAVFPSPTKTNAVRITNAQLREIVSAVSIPAVAIGGISYDNVCQIKGSSVSGVAVVSAIFGAGDIEKATTLLKERVRAVVEE